MVENNPLTEVIHYGTGEWQQQAEKEHTGSQEVV
jgi:hypothetical protein